MNKEMLYVDNDKDNEKEKYIQRTPLKCDPDL